MLRWESITRFAVGAMLEGFPKRLAPRQNNFVSMVPMMPAGRKQRNNGGRKRRRRSSESKIWGRRQTRLLLLPLAPPAKRLFSHRL